MTGFAAGEVMVITGEPDGSHEMVGKIVEIAESRVFHMKARWRRDHALVIDVPMQLVCKPRTKNRDDRQVPLGAWPVAWMRPYEARGEAKLSEAIAVADSTHKWLVVDPVGAVMR